MKMQLTLFSLAFACCGAFAQEATRPLGQAAADSRGGLEQISNGLYGRVDADGEQYVATTPEGHRALLEKLINLRANRAESGVLPNDPDSKGPFSDLIATLSAPQPKNQSVQGTCAGGATGSGPLFAQALAGGSDPYFGGSSYSFSGQTPPLDSTNYAHAETYDRDGILLKSVSDTEHGGTQASAFAYGTRACHAYSSATVTCPGHIGPSITATASYSRNNTTPCFLN